MIILRAPKFFTRKLGIKGDLATLYDTNSLSLLKKYRVMWCGKQIKIVLLINKSITVVIIR